MLIEDLIGTSVGLGLREVQKLKRECSQFLTESASIPLFKALPNTYANFHKVKVRMQRRRDHVTDIFERAFGQEFNNLRQRALYTYASRPEVGEGQDLFYVFPANGYRYLYNKEIHNSSVDCRDVYDTLSEGLADASLASDIAADLVKTTYASTNLAEGLAANAEIIFYGVPHFYAARVKACADYQKLLKT